MWLEMNYTNGDARVSRGGRAVVERVFKIRGRVGGEFREGVSWAKVLVERSGW
jgi:hypothetical protein